MDLEGFARQRILKKRPKTETVKELKELVKGFKEWDEAFAEEFSRAVYNEVKTSLGHRRLKDKFLKELLTSPASNVSMGEFGVGSRGEGDFKIHRDLADIIGGGGLIGPMDQDDAGVVEGFEGGFVTIAVDGIHSRLSEFPFLAGFHAARAALRDVFVMGSRPVALLTDLHLADDGDVGKLFDFTAGVSTIADATQIPIVSGSTLRVGGDMVFGDRLVAGVGAVGLSKSKPLARRRAEAGDVILLTLGKGGGTVSTTAIFNGRFNVVKETLNIDFSRAVETLFKAGLHRFIHAMTDVTNGGIRGDVSEISKVSATRLVLFEKEVRKSISPSVLRMLEDLNIDPLGVSTDSLMIIAPKNKVKPIKKSLAMVTDVYEAGFVEEGNGAVLFKSDGVEVELKPLFREAPYTDVKKVIGGKTPKAALRMSRYIDKAKKDASNKKRLVLERLNTKI